MAVIGIIVAVIALAMCGRILFSRVGVIIIAGAAMFCALSYVTDPNALIFGLVAIGFAMWRMITWACRNP